MNRVNLRLIFILTAVSFSLSLSTMAASGKKTNQCPKYLRGWVGKTEIKNDEPPSRRTPRSSYVEPDREFQDEDPRIEDHSGQDHGFSNGQDDRMP